VQARGDWAPFIARAASLLIKVQQVEEGRVALMAGMCGVAMEGR